MVLFQPLFLKLIHNHFFRVLSTPPAPFQELFYDLTISRSQHVEPAHLVLEAEVVSGRAAEVLRAPRLHLRSPQGHFKYLKCFPLKFILPYNLDSYFVSPSMKRSCCLTS